jgi:hypothetical protein
MPFRQRASLVVVLLVLAFISGYLGYGLGYFKATGTLPNAPSEIVLPVVNSGLQSTEVFDFVTKDTTNSLKYQEGFNCVEFGLLLARNAHWDGIPAEVIKVDFGDASHMILGFPTEDRGWIFVDPATDAFVYPRIGGEFAGGIVTNIWILRTEWIPFEK